MRMIEGLVVVLGLAVAAGCQSAASKSQPPPVPVTVKPAAVKPAVVKPAAAKPAVVAAPVVSAVGRQVQELVAAAGERPVKFFTADSQPLEQMPEAAAGSVSIPTADDAGQDNYTFDATGKVTKHLRSVGDNYSAGVWEEVR